MDMDIGGPGLTHNAALKLCLKALLYESEASPAWVYLEEATGVLQLLWQDACEWADDTEPLPEEPKLLEVYEMENYFVRLLQFPAPTTMPETYFAAIAFDPGKRSLFPWRRRRPDLRYLALELGFTLEGTRGTVLGEWTAEGHLNYGNGPDPSVEAFLKSVGELLTDKRELAGAMVPPR